MQLTTNTFVNIPHGNVLLDAKVGQKVGMAQVDPARLECLNHVFGIGKHFDGQMVALGSGKLANPHFQCHLGILRVHVADASSIHAKAKVPLRSASIRQGACAGCH